MMGGYVIIDLPGKNYTMLLAAGIANDLSFESDFCKRFGVKCVAYDGTIRAAPVSDSRVEWKKENIQPGSLRQYMNGVPAGSLFLKMDIEGAEIPWLESFTADELCAFGQIVIEFHRPFSLREAAVFKKLNSKFALLCIFMPITVVGCDLSTVQMFPTCLNAHMFLKI